MVPHIKDSPQVRPWDPPWCLAAAQPGAHLCQLCPVPSGAGNLAPAPSLPDPHDGADRGRGGAAGAQLPPRMLFTSLSYSAHIPRAGETAQRKSPPGGLS